MTERSKFSDRRSQLLVDRQIQVLNAVPVSLDTFFINSDSFTVESSNINSNLKRVTITPTETNLEADLFDIEEVLTSNDDLIIISKDKTNQTIKDLIEQLFIKDKKFVNIYNFHDYLFNVLEHEMQPKFRILSEEEKQKIMKQYNITKDKEFPDISRFDPVSQAMGVRPGEVMEITRSSPTAVKSVYFRICY